MVTDPDWMLLPDVLPVTVVESVERPSIFENPDSPDVIVMVSVTVVSVFGQVS